VRQKPIDLDFTKVYAGLKDFQRHTVDYVFERLYGDGASSTPRFLVADEVGLGKTLVARGLIARTIEHLERDVERIDVVYVCSNTEIARQNIQRLNVTGRGDFSLASRITLLPMVLHELSKNRLNFVSFTPGTSLELKSSEGIARERALLYKLLTRAWGASAMRSVGARRVFQGAVGSIRNFDRYIRNVSASPLDDGLVRQFATAVDEHDRAVARRGETTLREQFDDLRERFRRERKHRDRKDFDDRRLFVGAMRDHLAQVCMHALEPDLVILDEFQRFKHLLRPDDAAGELAQQLFAFRDHRDEPARVVLLSATPYKMYTVSEDVDDDHYADLIDTLRFLFGDETETAAFKREVDAYREALFRFDLNNLERVRASKDAIEKRLRRVTVRTERLSVNANRNGMLIERHPAGVSLAAGEVESFVAVDRLAQSLDAGDVVEYWKSSPYLLAFMDSYKLVRVLEGHAEQLGDAWTKQAVRSQRLLRWSAVENHRPIDPENPRLRSLITELLDAEAWRLLWVPPSLPYYRLAAPFDSEALKGFTKRLIFSAWAVAPKAIAALLSYEAERRMLGRVASKTTYSEARVRLKPLLRFSASGSRRLPGLPVLGMLYPSFALAALGDSLTIAAEDPGLGVGEVVSLVENRLRLALEPLLGRSPTDGRVDERWYWAAPLLLDHEANPAVATEWLARPRLSAVWAGPDERGGDFARHVDAARTIATEELGRPPDDLVKVLAQLALGGPGVASLRALSRVAGGAAALTDHAVRDGAARVAWGFRTLFNHPEVIALVRKPKAYWKAVLDYCVAGCLQAVLDEYAHVLVEWRGVSDRLPAEIVEALAETMHNSVALRTATYELRDFDFDAEEGPIRKRALRARFALRFGDNRIDEERDSFRPTIVREAFNSPFWPFVLATTSVGQEGLDFHLYCHSVMHWNLPANPVDLEQREGRVHRYKGHAIRKNLATAYSSVAFGAQVDDPWEAIFRAGTDHRPPGENDLVPSWVFLGGPARIERLVPTLPFSQDEARLAALKKSVAAYRLAFGQPRQEELVAFLGDRFDSDVLEGLTDQLRIDLTPAAP
jgi:Helicase conserved C-terminal domain